MDGVPGEPASHYCRGMTTHEPPPPPDDSEPEGSPPPGDSGESATSGLPSYGSVTPPEGSAPPPPPPPPPPPGAPDQAFSAPDAIGWGWRKFTAQPLPIIIGGAVWLIAYFLVSFVGGAAAGQSAYGMGGMGFSLSALVLGIVVATVAFTVGAFVARGALDVADGRDFDLGAAIGKVNVVNVVITALLVAVATQIGLLLLVIPGIVVSFLCWFALFYVVEDDATSPVDAITESVKLVSSRVGDSLLLALLGFLVMIAGAIALVVGLAVAYPIVLLASAYAYRRFRGQPVAA